MEPGRARSYEDALARVRALAPGEILRVPRASLTPRPRSWRRSLGKRVAGASAWEQWRDGVIHVHVTPTEYWLHRDTVDPHREPWRHLAEDAPEVLERLRKAARVALVALLVAGTAVAAARAFLAKRHVARS